MTKKILYTLMASAAVALSSSASASTITNLDLSAAGPFGGFDWSQNGTAVSSPSPTYISGQSITTQYFADAVSINKEGGGTFNSTTPGMIDAAPGGTFLAGQYEYTIVANINETVSCGAAGTECTTTATFTTTSGTFNIFYDLFGLATGGTVANQITGTGFTDGITLLSGTFNPGPAGDFSATLSGGTGNFSFKGVVTFTDTTYISPDQSGSNGVATLQFGDSVTNWTAPTGTPGNPGQVSGIAFQADGNQAISAVPEPGALALMSIGLLGLVGSMRSRERS